MEAASGGFPALAKGGADHVPLLPIVQDTENHDEAENPDESTDESTEASLALPDVAGVPGEPPRTKAARREAIKAARRAFDLLAATLPHEDRAALALHAATYLENDGLSNAEEASKGIVWTCLYRVRTLAVLMIFQSCSGFILDSYSAFIETHVFLTLYLTMLVGAGGNAGNQSAVNVIRGLATGELSRRDSLRVLFRETQAGVLTGLLLTSIGFWRVYLFQKEPRSSIAVSLSLFFITSISVVMGAFLPLAFDICGMDPAHAGPTIQVVMDVTGVFIACSVCSAVAGDVGVVHDDGGLSGHHTLHRMANATASALQLGRSGGG